MKLFSHCQNNSNKEYICKEVLFHKKNLFYFPSLTNRGQLFKERICSSKRSKFFPLKVDPNLKLPPEMQISIYAN